jgi:tRNA threonylcarbamoyl adenosine modification protein YjeE
MQFVECSITQLENIAQMLAKRVSRPTCIFLWGTIGSGKTVFAKRFIRTYFNDESIYVPSPTFTLIQTYCDDKTEVSRAKGSIWHADLFRVKDIAEVLTLGLEEAIYQHICIIEWPDRLVALNIANKVDVYLSVTTAETRAVAIRYT